MPPKAAAAKGKKSAKLSKAEKEKLKKEEAERKAREEEEARLQAEQEQQEREEKERQEREERERLRQQESARHQAEVDELKEKLESNLLKLKSLQQEESARAKWDRYMLCDGSPDPLDTRDLNTYMNLWREEKDKKPFHIVLNEGEETLQLIGELEKFTSSSEEEGCTEDDVQRLKQSVYKLQELISYKLDEATMNLLQNASGDVDPDTLNLQFMSSSENITVCVWGNIAKNPRVKSFSFDKMGFSMELPKVLSVGNVAVRIMYTKYDHLSPLSKSFYPKRKIKPPELVVEEAPPADETEGEGTGDSNEKPDKAGEDEMLEAGPPKSASQASRASKTSRKKSGRTSSGKSIRSRKASAKSIRSQVSDNEAQQEKEKEGETKISEQGVEGGEENAASTDQAGEELAAQDNVLYEEEEEEDDDVVDLRAFGAIGPLMFIELLDLPPQPKMVKGWTMQQIVSPEIKRISYQMEGQSAGESTSVHSTPAPPGSASVSQAQLATNPPVLVSFKLSGNVMYFEQPQLAQWDDAKNVWKMDALTEPQFNEEEKTLSFKMSAFGPIATFQDLYLNMPFQSWELRPHSTNSCLFTIIAAIVELEIEIKDSLCCLTQPNDAPELKLVRGKWMKPQQLMSAMQKAGINVFPAVDADKYVSISNKEDWLEENLYQQMSLTASAFAYTWSKWNADCGKDKFILQAIEQLEDEPPLEEDWFLYMISTHNSCKLRMKEENSKLSDDVAENTQLHSDLYHMVLDGACAEAQERVKDSNFMFVDCVYQMLNATRVMTYS